MRHLIFSILTTLFLIGGHVSAQSNVLEAGDPPVTSLITVSTPDENNLVTIQGAAGAVFPAAQVAIRNLYTGETVYTQAGITGQFTASLTGVGNTPYWISPATSIPPAVRNTYGSLPGGPGTIIYGAFPESRETLPNPITQLVIDGQPEDWGAYLNTTQGDNLDALRNLDSLYIQISQAPAEYDMLRLGIRANNVDYNILLDPRQPISATWTEASAIPRELGTIGVAATTAEVIEIRVPLAPLKERLFTDSIDTLQIYEVSYLDEVGNVTNGQEFLDAQVATQNEQDGIVYQNPLQSSALTRFSIAGTVAQGAASWRGRVRIDGLDFDPGDTLNMEIDVRLQAPDLPESQVNLAMIGQVALIPVATAAEGVISVGQFANHGWSNRLTDSGLPIIGLEETIILGEVVVPPARVIRVGDTLVFGMPLSLQIPSDLPAGMYVPIFTGYGQVGDGLRVAWGENGLLGTGERPPNASNAVRLPAVLNIGRTPDEPIRTIWTLFHAAPSDGSLGLLALEDRNRAGLSNHIRFNSPTYIITPNADSYPLEPYIINMMANQYDVTTPPLIPLLFPNGRINVTIQQPDGSIENLSSASIVQNMLSSATLDEQTRFGKQAPLDVYRVTTLNELFTKPRWDQYGEYNVSMTGFVEDVWGNRYEGGGTYTFLVAELLDVSPAMLSGTPLEVGDSVNLGVHLSPGIPATVTVNARLYPLDGSPVIEQQLAGTANSYGVYAPDVHFQITTPGEYVIDYEARYTDAEGRLWAASLRSAGVVASPTGTLIAHGQRGMANSSTDTRPAWYIAEQASNVPSTEAQVYTPYHIGDVAWIADSPNSGIQPRITVQDTENTPYERWFNTTHADYVSVDGLPTDELIRRDALPAVRLGASLTQTPHLINERLVNNAYTYTSYVTPAVTARQFVSGSENADGYLFWDMDDPLLGQIGAGSGGLRPGDYVFMFGGAVVRNPDAGVLDSAIYASTGVVIGENDERGTRVLPPYRGAAGGPDGGGLIIEQGELTEIFFHPTAIRAGDVLEIGDTLAISGQIAPTLPSDVTVTVRAPSGELNIFGGRANAIGYFYHPDGNITVDQVGVWTVDITVSHSGASSASQTITPPLPTQTIRYNLYVVPQDHERLVWSQETDISIPAGFPFNFNFDVPAGWTDVTAYQTIRFPGYIVEDRAVPLQGIALRYQFNPTALNQQFPFYEGQDGRLAGGNSSDPVMMTFALQGTNANGEADMQVRQVVIRHDRLITLE